MADATPVLESGEYQATMHRVVLAAQCIEGEPFDRMLATIEAAHTVGPILYPDDYRAANGTGSLDAQQRMLTTARDFVGTLREVREKCA